MPFVKWDVKKDLKDVYDVYLELECNGLCMLNVSGQYIIWKTVCSKCKGTKQERDVIDKSFNSFNARQIILNKYEFSEEEKDILYGEWY